MNYAQITTSDRNRLKRWIQRRRLRDAVAEVVRGFGDRAPASVLDFGGGNGELAWLLHEAVPGAAVTCYEPAESLRAEAAQRLRGSPVRLSGRVDSGGHDLVTCCEVLEHLPDTEVDRALDVIAGAMAPGAVLVVGVPNEIHVAALVKGVFRMVRRYGAYDAQPATVLAAVRGRPRPDRPVSELDGLPFVFPHTGFDHRALAERVGRAGFEIVRVFGSPWRRLPVLLNSEIYLVLRRREPGSGSSSGSGRSPSR